MSEQSSLLYRMRSALEATYGRRLQLVVLYGSEARGDARPDSDIDLLVLLDQVADYGAEVPISAKPVAAQEYETVDCPLCRRVHQEGIAA